MADGRKSNGGKRNGSGRKPKEADELVRALCVKAIEKKYGSLEKGVIALLESEEASLRKFVFEHALGKPTENVDLKTGGESLNIFLKKVDGR